MLSSSKLPASAPSRLNSGPDSAMQTSVRGRHARVRVHDAGRKHIDVDAQDGCARQPDGGKMAALVQQRRRKHNEKALRPLEQIEAEQPERRE